MKRKKGIYIAISLICIIFIGCGFYFLFSKSDVENEKYSSNKPVSDSVGTSDKEDSPKDNQKDDEVKLDEEESNDKENSETTDQKEEKDKEQIKEEDKKEENLKEDSKDSVVSNEIDNSTSKQESSESKKEEDKKEDVKEPSKNPSDNSNDTGAVKPTPTPPKPTPTPPKPPVEDKKEYVTISVECSNAVKYAQSNDTTGTIPSNGIILPTIKAEIKEGDTVFDVLARTMKSKNIAIQYSGAATTVYIESMNNLGEFDCGDLSGWMYNVNGVYPNYGCGAYKVSKGDVIQWRYTCDLGKDVGENMR